MDLFEAIFEAIDPRLSPALRTEAHRRRDEVIEPLPRGVTIVLAGHRAAGKSRVLSVVMARMGRIGFDLDREIERRTRRPLKSWIEEDEASFRQTERRIFRELPAGSVVAVGGGFLSLHRDLLAGMVVVEVPVSFATYAQRLREDTTRPRLRKDLTLEEELSEVYAEREELHRAARPMPIVDFALRLKRGLRPRRVVTLPPGQPAAQFAWRARHAGADLLEIRTDVLPHEMDLRPASLALPLLVSQRGSEPVPKEWRRLASVFDRPIELGDDDLPIGGVVSLHAEKPMSTTEAVARWRAVQRGVSVKHIEPLGELDDLDRLFRTRASLMERFGDERVTVLVTGPLALPFRAILGVQNALDFTAMDSSWRAAPGQRLLADAAREWRRRSRWGETERLGIVGHNIDHSRSPRIHAQPFDRIDLPEDVDLEALVRALRPHYRGFAITNPFKKRAAALAKAPRAAINTLVRTAGNEGWATGNTDVAGAKAVLEELGGRVVTVLGDGGVTDAIREAALALKIDLSVVTRANAARAISGDVVWTWPAGVEPPAGLRLDGARVAVIAYGAPARIVAGRVASLGGTPLKLGPRWFVAQARAQRELWEQKK